MCKGYGERTHMRRDQAGKIVEHGKDDMVHHHHYSPHPAPPTCPLVLTPCLSERVDSSKMAEWIKC